MIDVKKTCIGVVGAGTMGAGIAQAFAAAGARVLLCDASAEALGRAKKRIGESADKLHAKEKGPAGAEVLGRIEMVAELKAFAPCQWVIEAIVEQPEPKKAVFAELARITGQDCILASNTSSIPIEQLAAAAGAVEGKKAARVLGLHFMNPVPIMVLVEIVLPKGLEPAALTASLELIRAIGKTPVSVADVPGFAANRLLMPLINEAFLLWESSVASAEDIDTICKLGFAHPMGPLALADLIGLDVVLAILNEIHTQGKLERYKPSQRLQELVAAGRLGRKTKRGVFEY